MLCSFFIICRVVSSSCPLPFPLYYTARASVTVVFDPKIRIPSFSSSSSSSSSLSIRLTFGNGHSFFSHSNNNRQASGRPCIIWNSYHHHLFYNLITLTYAPSLSIRVLYKKLKQANKHVHSIYDCVGKWGGVLIHWRIQSRRAIMNIIVSRTQRQYRYLKWRWPRSLMSVQKNEKDGGIYSLAASHWSSSIELSPFASTTFIRTRRGPNSWCSWCSSYTWWNSSL